MSKKKSHFEKFGVYVDKHYPKRKNDHDEGDAYSQTQSILSRFVQDDAHAQIHSEVFNRLIGAGPLRKPPQEDMPALEKIKLYARSGYHLHHIGTDEDFELVWEEAFKKESKFKFLADSRREKGGKDA